IPPSEARRTLLRRVLRVALQCHVARYGVAEGDCQSAIRIRVSALNHDEVQVGVTGEARAAGDAEYLALLDLLADVHVDSALRRVVVQTERAVAVVDNHVITGDSSAPAARLAVYHLHNRTRPRRYAVRAVRPVDVECVM